jgi:hypothetical protein
VDTGAANSAQQRIEREHRHDAHGVLLGPDGSSRQFFQYPWSFIIAWQVRSANAEIVGSGLTPSAVGTTDPSHP